VTWEALMAAARERFQRFFGRGGITDADDCGCSDGADDFDADELGLDPED